MKKIPLYVKILAGMGAGVLLGFIALWTGQERFVTDWITPWGTLFMRLLKLVAIPLIFLSLVKGISNLNDIRSLSRIGLKTVVIYVGTTMLAISLGLGMSHVIQPGAIFPQEKAAELREAYGADVATNTVSVQVAESGGPMAFIVDIVPDNMLAAGSNNNKMLQIIFIAVMFGVALTAIGRERVPVLFDFFDGMNELALKLVHYAMLFAPWGVLALMADMVVGSSGHAGVFGALGAYVLTILVCMLIITFALYPALLRLFTKVGVRRFFRAISPVQLLALTTSSSAATLPVTMKQTEEELGVSNEVASFVLPVGVTVNMDGSSCYQAVATVFIAQAIGLDLTFAQLVTILLVATLSSIGSPGIPGGSVVTLMMVLASVGIPVEWIALILGVDRPVDMMRTVVNVTGDVTVACIIEEGEKKRK